MYVRQKNHHGGGSDYYQLVESRRVDGKPRQQMVLHLGGCATVEEALKRWPAKIKWLRRSAYGDHADALQTKLAQLRELRNAGKV